MGVVFGSIDVKAVRFFHMGNSGEYGLLLLCLKHRPLGVFEETGRNVAE